MDISNRNRAGPFRHLEHRLQFDEDRQTHRLPEDPAALELIADELRKLRVQSAELRVAIDAVRAQGGEIRITIDALATRSGEVRTAIDALATILARKGRW